MCLGQLPDDVDVFEVIKLAHYYKMDLLFWECVNKLIKSVSVNNFVHCIKLFDKYEIKKGYMTLVDFGKQHLGKLEKTNDFQELSHSFRCVLGHGER